MHTDRVLRCLVKGATIPMKVSLSVDDDVDDLKAIVHDRGKNSILRDTDIQDLFVWKLNNQETLIPEESLGDRISSQGPLSTIAVKLESSTRIGDIFKDQPKLGLHIVVQLVPSPTISPSTSLSSNISSHASIGEHPPTASLKRPHSPSVQGSHEERKKRTISHPFSRKWTVNGAITQYEVNRRYYVDPGTQDVTSRCLNAISEGTYVLLAGARASGKSTRLIWLRQKLETMGYWVLYISFDSLTYWGSREDFWKSFGFAINSATPILSTAQFMSYFHRDSWDRDVVILLDEFSCLYKSEDAVRDDCLNAIRGLRHNRVDYVVQSVIAAGTFSIIHLNPTETSPFNVANFIQSEYFTIDETRKLFREFASDSSISIDGPVIDDIWTKSNGHPAMVCLCGRTIQENMKAFMCPQSRNISYHSWQCFPPERLYGEISQYNTFHSMIQSLSRAEAFSSVDLLRSQFTGFLCDVTLTDEKAKKDADTLTSEGVLLKPVPAIACYRMASALVDGLIRNQLIPAIFPNAPSSPLPLQQTGNVDVLAALIESLKFFDKALIFNASSCSYKKAKVKIPGSHGCHVPRESVYDTELMRILANWLRKNHWSVNGQWHSENDLGRHKYSDIVLKKNSHTIVLKLLATGEPSSVESHIQKTPEYAALLSANEAWVVHFTRQEDYLPIWPSDMSVNVVHFAHDPGFTNVVMSARWKDCAGEIQEEVGKSLPLD